MTLKNSLRNLINSYQKWQLYRTTYNELSGLSDHQLNDMGIARGDIQSIARGDTSCYANPNLRGWA